MAVLPRRARGTALATLLCGLFLMAVSSPALAHDRLKRSTPAQNATVAAVDVIELEFSARVRLPAVVLHDAAGATVPIGAPQAERALVTTPVPAALPPGRYVIGWRVVSSDGHPIEGRSRSPCAVPTARCPAPRQRRRARPPPAGASRDCPAGSGRDSPRWS
ncbi:copper resistance protein CopC [Nonomuraea sp. NBC_01738]|uniref:copper resistance CopC family protein n=1 Tax=Nonomuraea sp. NBC_01738 TaxID=2976003 RepID=UPI002E139B7D|nr:copper resistance protein CopC [Nonomuraea sp. NBC_01738]